MILTHLQAAGRLSAYLDGELPAGRARAVERHLAGCAACAARLEGLRRAQAALRAIPRSAPPAEGWARLREQMAVPALAPAGAAVPRRLPAWGLAAAGLLMLVAASLYLASGPNVPRLGRGATSFVSTADFVDDEHVALSPSIELLLVARHNDGPDAREDR